MVALAQQLVTVFAVCLVLLVIVVLFMVLYWLLSGPNANIVVPLIAGVGIGYTVIAAGFLGSAAERVRKAEFEKAKGEYLAVKANVTSTRSGCSLSDRDICLRTTLKMPEGREKGVAQDACENLSSKTECTDQAVDACVQMMRNAEPKDKIQFDSFRRNSKLKIADLLQLCNVYAQTK